MCNIGRMDQSLVKARKPTAHSIPIGSPSSGWPLCNFCNGFVQSAKNNIDCRTVEINNVNANYFYYHIPHFFPKISRFLSIIFCLKPLFKPAQFPYKMLNFSTIFFPISVFPFLSKIDQNLLKSIPTNPNSLHWVTEWFRSMVKARG